MRLFFYFPIFLIFPFFLLLSKNEVLFFSISYKYNLKKIIEQARCSSNIYETYSNDDDVEQEWGRKLEIFYKDNTIEDIHMKWHLLFPENFFYYIAKKANKKNKIMK